MSVVSDRQETMFTPVFGNDELFPQLKYKAYLAHAAISPLSRVGGDAIEEYIRSMSRHGSAAFPTWLAQRERLRSSLAALLRVQSSRVGLSAGCTHAISDVALALPWRSGSTLVSYEGEFPANIIPYQQAAAMNGAAVELLSLPPANSPSANEQILDELERVFKDPSKNVAHFAVSAVQFQTGLHMPLREMGQLCERYGITFLVDGIQAAGVVDLDLDVLGVDAFFCGAHKWLLGVEGAGFSVLSERLAARLQPKTAGWLSSEGATDFLFQGAGLLRYDQPFVPAPRVFEGSTQNAIGFVALESGVGIVSSLGPKAIFDHVQGLFDRIEPQLVERGFRSLRAPDAALRSCILSFLPPAGLAVARLFSGLDERGIRVSIPDGVLRLAPHFHNSKEQMDLVVDAVDELLRE